MHLVVMAWLFVIGTMALTMSSALGAIAFFAGAGLAPVALYFGIRLRALRASRSVLQQRVDRRDDADARRDQQ